MISIVATKERQWHNDKAAGEFLLLCHHLFCETRMAIHRSILVCVNYRHKMSTTSCWTKGPRRFCRHRVTHTCHRLHMIWKSILGLLVCLLLLPTECLPSLIIAWVVVFLLFLINLATCWQGGALWLTASMRPTNWKLPTIYHHLDHNDWHSSRVKVICHWP